MRKTNTSTISIIGASNVATHLALALHGTGHTIHQVLSRDYSHAERLASLVDAEPIDNSSLLTPHSSLYLLAVNDDSLYNLAATLRLPGALVLHTSGSTPADILAPVSNRYGVVWSPQTFVRDIPMDYRHLPLCIEGSTSEATETIEKLFATVSDNIHRLDYGQRRWTHLAAVMVNNFGNAVNALAQDISTRHGIDFALLRPLADATLAKMDHGDLWPQQTGPAVRHDNKTLDLQRSLLADNPKLLQLYNLMTEIIQNRDK